jgi:hydroxymethylpyrimidine/phosphomethylpyrimidine kinase
MPLLARATLVTPNLSEAAVLTGAPVTSADEARSAAQELIRRGARAVLVKGGHLPGDANDQLIWKPDPGHEPELFEWLFPAPRIAGASPRGTGCALATAIAVGLAAGQPLAQAVLAAKTWLHERIAGAAEVDGERVL